MRPRSCNAAAPSGLTPPVLGDFSWVNQDIATANEVNGVIHLSKAALAASSYNILKKAAPATPYVVTTLVRPIVMPVAYSSAGLCFRESGSGKLHIFHLSTATALVSGTFSSPTVWAGTYGTFPVPYPQEFWMRIADDGVNRICSWSPDGVYWFLLHSVARANYLTADEVGFCIDAQNLTYGVGLDLLSWKET
jgi:hypothetical protein